ncbi:hypothetical protein [Natribacillus halophilus]|uniref:Aldehyde dehydrogenase family protein n=1 Tax=Natribacillus halophilus TaxID=549003 RepID=A0A1G8MVV2_9BACI|nr:hypothetical protein SAMN04488123_10560 [Natribacillus halophilus]
MLKMDIAVKHPLFIGGKWQEANQYDELRSPYSSEKITEIPKATSEETEAAIQAAENAQEEMQQHATVKCS